MRIRRGPSRALASISILTTAAALAIGTLPSAASAASAAAGRTASHAQSAHSLASARSGPSVQTALAAAAARAAASARPGTSAAASPVTGAITGTVRGLGSAPLPGACVTATGSGRSVTTRARAGGRFAIAGLTPGAYTVSYRDCAQPGKYFDQWYGGALLATGATPVTVSAGQPALLAPVTLRATDPAAAAAAMQPAVQARLGQMSPAAASGGVISGTVRSRSGQPLTHVCVDAYSRNDYWEVRSGPKGGYRLPVGTTGKWTVMFSSGCGNSGNYAPQWWRRIATPGKATRLTEHSGRSFHGIDGVLRRGATITGTVRSSASGAGVARVCVFADGIGRMSGYGWSVMTRADGSYTMPNLGTGRYKISFRGECVAKGDYLSSRRKAAVAVTDGSTTSGIDGTVRPGAEIHGVVTAAAGGAPVARVCVDDQQGDEAITGPGGQYALTGLKPGTYTLSFSPGCGASNTSGSYAPQYYDNVLNPGAATPLHLATGQVASGIDAALQPGGTVTGQATSRSGAPLAGVCIDLTSRNQAGGLGQDQYDLALLPLLDFEEAGFGHTGPKGHFTIRNLLPGQYTVTFSGGCGDGSAKYAPRPFEPQGGGQWISVSGGAVTAGVDATLQVGGILTGEVTGRHGAPVSGVCVTPVRHDGGLTYFLGTESHRDGSYSVGGLASGRYAVVFTPCGRDQSYAAQWYKDKPSQASATLITVTVGHATRPINAGLKAGGTITGQIRSGVTGKPLKGVCVLLADSGNNAADLFLTNAAGQYRMPHVPAGRWQLEPSQCLTASPSVAGVVRGYSVRYEATTRANITMPRSGSISGTVQGGSPAAAESGICVEATPVAGHGQPGVALTGPDGSYTVPGLASGKYRVLFTPLCLFGTADVTPQWYNGASSAAAASPVTVTGGQASTGIGATLAADGAISGTVTVSGTATAGVCVGAYAGSSAKPATIAITGKDGSYQISGLTAGSYSVEFSTGCGASSYAAQWYGGTTRAAATPVTVTAGATATGIDAS